MVLPTVSNCLPARISLASDNEHGCCRLHSECACDPKRTGNKVRRPEQVWGTRCCESAQSTFAVTEFRYDEGNPFGLCCSDRKRGFRSIGPIGFDSRNKRCNEGSRGKRR